MFEVIDSAELAKRWGVPESWVRGRVRARTVREARIPHVRLGKYVRFEWVAKDSRILASFAALHPGFIH